jgi:hypothetical protein
MITESRILKGTISTLAMLFALTSVAGAKEKLIHPVSGAGARQCSEITEMYQSKDPLTISSLNLMVGSWVGGYMSAANYFRKEAGEQTKDLSSPSIDDQILAVRRYCIQHPDNIMMLSVTALFISLADDR